MALGHLRAAKRLYSPFSSSSSDEEEDEDDLEYYGQKRTSKDASTSIPSNHNAENFIGGSNVGNSDEDDKTSILNHHAGFDSSRAETKTGMFDRIFSFQLPFGGKTLGDELRSKEVSYKNLIPLFSPNSGSSLNLKALSKLLPKNFSENDDIGNDLSQSDEDTTEIARTKSRILAKIEKYNSISSYEEYLFYKNVRGVKSDRLRAFKKIFTPNTKKLIINSATGSNVITENEKPEGEEEMKISKKLYEYNDLPIDFKQHDMNNHEDIEVSEVFSRIKGHVIFIHGYRGATLRVKSTNERVWIPLKETILGQDVETNNTLPNLFPLPNSSTRDYLTIPPSMGIFEEDENIVATKILKKVGPIDIMNKLVSQMRHVSEQKDDLTVWEFPYDWRLALDVTSEKLKTFIQENIKPKEGERNDIFVVAHSMGGLITHKIMNENPLWFKGIVYVGCPSLVPNMLGPLRHGDSILLNKKILTPEVSFLFRSSFYFLPQKVQLPDVHEVETRRYGRVNGTSTYVFVNDKDFNIKYDIDYFDPETWKKYKLSPCLDEEMREREFRDIPFNYKPEEHYEYLKKLLPVVNKYLNALEYDPSKKGLYPPLVTLYGDTIPTTKGCRVPSLDSIQLGEWENFFYGRGDGVVSEKWLLPEHRGFHKLGKFSSSEGHVSLLNDIEGIARCFDYLLKEWDM